MNSLRAKSADFPRTAALPMEFHFQTRSSTILIDELRRIEKEERELNLLNSHFASYLNRIIELGDTNIKLRRQVDEIRRNYTGPIDHQKEYILLHQQLNTELRSLTSVRIRSQRADSDKKYYKNQLQYLSSSDQLLLIHQQFDAYSTELNLLKEQYAKQTEELQLCKKQYNEYTTKLIEYTDEYNRIVSERMQSANSCCTLEEQILFEREFNSRCKEEFEYLEKIEYDLNDQLTKKEFEKIIEQIREDYQKYNEIQLSELEVLYEIQLSDLEVFYETQSKTIEKNLQQDEKEDIQPWTEENRILEEKLKQLESHLRQLTEQNQQQYERLNNEYHELELRVPEFESSIEISRHNMVHLTSEINTYRCLLINLVQKPKLKPKPTEFTVHFGNGIIWCRI